VLNQRQNAYLDIFYQLDQEEQQRQQRRWHQKLHRDPANQWRWIPYDTSHPAAEATSAQELLSRRGLQDAGTGSTLAALVRRRLIEIRHTSVDVNSVTAMQTQVRLTTRGRAVARANRPTPQENERLADWLHQALHTVAAATDGPTPKTHIGRAAARKLGPRGLGYIEDANAWAYRLTDIGRDYLGLTGDDG
jgi:DNA-binding MarR family transcriptional regulator